MVALIGDDRVTLTKIHPAGLFEVVLPRSDIPAYRLEVAYGDRSFTIDDPYRFWPTIGELDEHLVGEATHERLWEKLGAHERTLDAVAGTSGPPTPARLSGAAGPIALVAATTCMCSPSVCPGARWCRSCWARSSQTGSEPHWA